jgi:serine/threonine-protein kinase
LIDELVLERYRIRELIGEGGMGRVYAAEQRVGTTVRRVAVKTLRAQLSADAQVVKRFYREAETIVRLTHPNIISFFDFGALSDGTLVLVMEHVDGESLAAHLARGPLSTARVDGILAQVCGALAEAHGLGIVHRDLKPDNILLTTRGGQTDFVKVLDFGIAKLSAQEQDATTKLTQQGMIVGTPPYMSPEQFRGDQVDPRSDVYSLGVIAYEMHTGRLPFDARTPWEWASKHLTAEPEQLHVSVQTGVSKQRALAIQRALSKTPEGRPATVEQFLEELRSGESGAARPALSAGSSVSGNQEPEREASEAVATAELAKHRTAWWGGAVLVAAALATIAAVTLTNTSHQATQAPSAKQKIVAARDTAPGETAPLGPQPQKEDDVAVAPFSPSTPTKPAGADAPELGAARAARVSARKTAIAQPSHEDAKSPERGNAALPDALRTVSKPETAASSTHPRAIDPQDSAPAAQTPSGPTPSPTSSMPADLAERVKKATEQAAQRPEVAIGMYRGAVLRYGADHPALLVLAGTLRRESDRRLKELLGKDRCAQAQALFRALTSAGLAGAAARSFSSACPAP